MTLGPRILRLGAVRISEKHFAFTPAPSLEFDAALGEAVDLALPYHFEEASAEREDCVLTSRIDLAGRELGESRAEFNDRPVLHDEVQGALIHRTRLTQRGELRGVVRLRMTYRSASWDGGAAHQDEAVERTVPFTLRVR